MSLADSLIVKTEVIMRAVRNDKASEDKLKKTGKPSPVYMNKEYLVYTRANGSQWIRPAYPLDRAKKDLQEAFAAFDARQLVQDQGAPLTELQGVTPAEVATLEEIGFSTVEALSNMSLAQAKDLGAEGRFEALREYAQTFLRHRVDMEKVFHLEKVAEDKDMEIERLKMQLAEKEVAAPVAKKPVKKAKVVKKKEVELTI